MKVISAFAIMPFASAVGANDKVVDFISWTPGQNIALCKGDCDTDAECANSEYGVKCIHETHEDRQGGTIPGCSGMTHAHDSSTDYCYCPSGTNCDPITPPPTPAPTYVNEGEYTEDNFECHPSNCNDWDCATWCKCFSDEDEETGAYEQAGCVDDGDESCKCVSNVYDVHEFPENWKLVDEAKFVPNERYPTQLHDILVAAGEGHFAVTQKTFHRPLRVRVDMKQEKESRAVASYKKFDDTICKFHRVEVMMSGDLKAQCEAKCDSSKQKGGCPGFSVSETHRYCYICANVQHYEGTDYKVNYGPETGQKHWNNYCDGGHWCTTQYHGMSQLYWKTSSPEEVMTPECGVLQVFPQKLGITHSGYNAGINWWTNKFGAGIGNTLMGQDGPTLTANESSINEFNLFQRVEIELDEDGSVRYYLNGELRHEVFDTSLQSGVISIGNNCRNYRFKDLRVSKGSKDGSVPVNPAKRTTAYQEKWGEIYATQWDTPEFFVEKKTGGASCSEGGPIATPKECQQVAPTLLSLGGHGPLTFVEKIALTTYIPGCMEGANGKVYWNDGPSKFDKNLSGHALCTRKPKSQE